MSLRVIQYGDPVLREKGESITSFDAALKQLAADMVELMYEADGAGLAAQQVGKALQFCVIDLRSSYEDGRVIEFKHVYDGKELPMDVLFPLALVNPQFEERSMEVSTRDEACLSLPHMYGPVTRPNRVLIHFQDLEGISHTLDCDGFLARCIQHELDHLEGVLYIDHLEPRELDKLKTKLKKLKRETRDFMKKQERKA